MKRAGALRRTPLARGKGLRARSVQATKRPRDTGPDQRTRAIVLGRSGGCCELCGRLLHDGTTWLTDRHSIHHRRPRGAGGSSWSGINLPSNLLLLCGDATTPDGCHAFVEAHRTSAYDEGWLVHQAQDPATVVATVHAGIWSWRTLDGSDPVVGSIVESPRFTRRVLLTDDGDYQDVAA